MANVVRILTFRVSHCSPEQNERQSQCIGLALNEFPGFVSGQCLTEVSMGIVVGVSVWESRARKQADRRAPALFITRRPRGRRHHELESVPRAQASGFP